MSKYAKKVVPINFINLYTEDDLEYADEHYHEANQCLQDLDNRNYLETFYFKEKELLH